MNSTKVLSYFSFFSPRTRSAGDPNVCHSVGDPNPLGGGPDKGNSKNAPDYYTEFPNQTDVLKTPWATYRLMEIIGKGAFGLVMSANATYDQCARRSTNPVAIKRVSQIFSSISNA